MLNWLKKKAKVSFPSRYPNILRRSTSPEMFLPHETMMDEEASVSQVVKLFLYNPNGVEYSLSVPPEMNYRKHQENGTETSSSGAGHQPTYRLVLVRDFRDLLEEKSVGDEELIDNDKILLVERRPPRYKHPIFSDFPSNQSSDRKATLEQIKKETAKLSSKNTDSTDNTPPCVSDIALRQILMTMIEVSIHLITPDDDAADLFVLVFEHLEKRHKPRVDKNSLKQLTDMGFSEARAIKALQFKGNVVEATDWLLDETNKTRTSSDSESDVLLIPPERRKSFFMSGKDPAEKVMQEFSKYVEKWFVADPRALKSLKDLGYGEDISKEALRITCNNEALAKDFLEGKTPAETFKKGFDRDSHIMSAILESPVVQVALSKPKTLFALMVLCETPSNINVWLSDPETHPVVSQILRIYHLEKHRLHESVNTSESNTDTTTHNSEPPGTTQISSSETFIMINNANENEVPPQASTSFSGDRLSSAAESSPSWSKDLTFIEEDSSDNMEDIDPI
ncbi:Ubiquitin-associated domain-containing protein 1 [Armadillidium nasatum]|uniref:Ubiquitin-associated domain-containing protein 1 n=1 Tax=Armadillidium nasatum TaxID=96803 RepID=A0A5N5TPH3_9CRUS|nr:Ubiquitin-associated domain-containing protein 1 [Armadillidium nasatum]